MKGYKGTITRRLDSVLDGLQSEFKNIYTAGDFECRLKALRDAKSSEYPSRLRSLYDLFDDCGISYKRDEELKYYEELVHGMELPDTSQVENRMLDALYARYREYPAPRDYMERMVERLGNPADVCAGDSLRLRILKQFMKYGNYLKDAGYSGRTAIADYVKNTYGKRGTTEELVRLVDDGVFKELQTATKEQKKPKGKYGLLKVADDLAEGNFRAEGATRKSLYLFAMVYGMTYSRDGEEPDPKTDIEINLFRDYYTNNLMRFISGVYRGNLSEFEQDPSGLGINYKNFAEIIYLYYISKGNAYTPEEKIRRSTEMIGRVQGARPGRGKPKIGEEKDRTVYYRNHLYSKDILDMSEPEFERFVCENYDCDTDVENHQVGVMQLETEQNTAYAEYQDILDKLRELEKKAMDELREFEAKAEDCNKEKAEDCKEEKAADYNYGLWFKDVAAFQEYGYEKIRNEIHGFDQKTFDEFLELLLGMNRFMVGFDWKLKETSGRKTRAIHVESPKDITRTSLIVAYYYYYNANHLSDPLRKWKSFGELFADFKNGIDLKLERANYQLFCGKNIFDVLVAFSSYAYLNI